jgi:hypothetical protein
VERNARKTGSSGSIAVEDDEVRDESSHSCPPLDTSGGTALSDPEKAEALADSLESQFQPVNDPSDPAVIDKVTEALQACSYAPANESMFTYPMEVQDAIRGLKYGKAPGSNGLPNRAL